MKKVQWNRLLNEIKDQRIVPIIGEELLRLDLDGKEFFLYDRLAFDLARELELDLPKDPIRPITLSDVAFAYRDEGGDLLDVSYEVAELLRSYNEVIPDPLRKLAQIRHFNLFICTTPDSLLKRALDDVRYDGRNVSKELTYSPMMEVADLPDDYNPATQKSPLIFHMFGSAEQAPDFVVTEDDLLKYANSLQSPDNRPVNLFDTLLPNSLAWMGTSYPDWLIRFLLCSARGESLFVTNSAPGYVADQNSVNNHGLRSFLNRHHAVLYELGDSISFVEELFERWQERFGGKPPEVPTELPDESLGLNFPKNGVFISYASEDLEPATNLCNALSRYGVQVWLDKESLRGGDQWEYVIRRNIESCSIFLPLLSRNTQTLDRRFFRMEWSHAIRESEIRPNTFPFIQPIVVDDSSLVSEYHPPKFHKLHCNRFINGIPDGDFLERSKSIVRSVSRQQRRNLS